METCVDHPVCFSILTGGNISFMTDFKQTTHYYKQTPAGNPTVIPLKVQMRTKRRPTLPGNVDNTYPYTHLHAIMSH